MPDYDDTTFTQPIPRSPPHPRRLDRSRERYPRDGSVEEVYVEKRQFSRDNHSPKGHLAIRHEEFVRRPRHHSRSVDIPRRQVAFRDEDARDDGDSDDDYKRSRTISRRKSDRHLKIVPCGENCNDHPRKAHPYTSPKSHTNDSDSDYSSSEESSKQTKHRNRKLLYTGLACVTTVAAANNIYQNTKAHHVRRNQMREGDMCTSEVKRLKNKALLMDLFTAGVVAVGINNARVGWKRVEAIKQEGR